MKHTLFEASARVPLIGSGARVTARDRSCLSTVQLLDVNPTLADICGLRGAGPVLHGRSLAPLLRDRAAP